MRICVLLAAALPLAAGEIVVLNTGFQIRADRHESAGELIRLVTDAGAIELPSHLVATILPDGALPAPDTRPAAHEKLPTTPSAFWVAEELDRAAERHGLPPEFVRSVAEAESALRPDAISAKGAIGVMQLMPATAAALNADPYNPQQNVDAGVRLLRDLLIQYDGSTFKALAAYNAGEGAVETYGGIPPYRETRLYVDKVIRNYLRRTNSTRSN